MDMVFKNVMETLVNNKLEEVIDTLDCCKCEKCKMDIMAYALNILPSKYVVTSMGELYSKVDSLNRQHDTDILTALVKAAQIVDESPRH